MPGSHKVQQIAASFVFKEHHYTVCRGPVGCDAPNTKTSPNLLLSYLHATGEQNQAAFYSFQVVL